MANIKEVNWSRYTIGKMAKIAWTEGSHIILIIFTTGEHELAILWQTKSWNPNIFSSGLVPSAPSPPPSIVSLPKTVSLARGERAVLECAVRPQPNFHSTDDEGYFFIAYIASSAAWSCEWCIWYEHLFWQVRHLGEGRQLVWRRGFDVLATANTKLSPDPRISVHQKGS